VSELVRLDICWLLELVLLIFSSHEITSRRQSLARSDFATHMLNIYGSMYNHLVLSSLERSDCAIPMLDMLDIYGSIYNHPVL
jgi:hypothetical protein